MTVLNHKSLNESQYEPFELFAAVCSLNSKKSIFTGAVGSIVSIVTYTISVITTGAMITAFGGTVTQN
jgi:hypothetical protein